MAGLYKDLYKDNSRTAAKVENTSPKSTENLGSEDSQNDLLSWSIVTPQMVEDAMKNSYVNGCFSYNKFYESVEKNSLFHEDYLPLDMLELIIINTGPWMLLASDIAMHNIESNLNELKHKKVLDAYFDITLDKHLKTKSKVDAYKDWTEELYSSNLDDDKKIRIFATKCITDPEFEEIVKKNKFSKPTDEFIKKATPETVVISMTSDLETQLQDHKSSMLIVMVDDFDKNKIEKLLGNKNILSLNLYNNPNIV